MTTPSRRTLISGGTLVTAVDTFVADIAIVDGVIASIFGPGAAPAGPWNVTLDARGKYVMPGGIDAHTHISWSIPELNNETVTLGYSITGPQSGGAHA